MSVMAATGKRARRLRYFGGSYTHFDAREKRTNLPRSAVRIKSLLHQLLGLEYTRVVDCAFADDGLVIDVAPTWRQPRCSSCGYTCPGYDRATARRWRHMDAAGMELYLRYDTRRVDCVRCGVTVEHLPWADVGVWFTRPFEDHVGYLAQRSDKSGSGGKYRRFQLA